MICSDFVVHSNEYDWIWELITFSSWVHGVQPMLQIQLSMVLPHNLQLPPWGYSVNGGNVTK